jgi:hypothetical protein
VASDVYSCRFPVIRIDEPEWEILECGESFDRDAVGCPFFEFRPGCASLVRDFDAASTGSLAASID